MANLSAPAPVRAIGWRSLTAICINGMIGAGILILPANIAQLLGGKSLYGYIVAACAVILVALCFAEASSLFESSGGPYLYAREAFGRFVGFQAGILLTLSRVAGAAPCCDTPPTASPSTNTALNESRTDASGWVAGTIAG